MFNLEPGAYRVLAYAPADGTPTGPMDVNGMLIPNLPGQPGTALTRSLAWNSTPTFVPDGDLTIEEAASGPCTGLAGLQIERAVPLPEPGMGLGLLAGIGCVVSIVRIRSGRGRARGNARAACADRDRQAG